MLAIPPEVSGTIYHANLANKCHSLDKCYKMLPLATLEYTKTFNIGLTLASDIAILYGNDVFSILVLSTEEQQFILSFFRKSFKTFKISTNCHIRTCQSLKRRNILQIPSTGF